MTEEAERDATNRAIRQVLSTPEGKRFAFWILEECALYSEAFAGPGRNEATNYTLGAQGVGRRVITRLDELDPRIYPTLLLDIADLKAMDRAIAAKDAPTKD